MLAISQRWPEQLGKTLWWPTSQKTTCVPTLLRRVRCPPLGTANMLRYQASTALQLHVVTGSLPLPKLHPKKPQTFIPYILAREELRLLLDAIPYRRKDALLQPPTVRMILLLLYGAGLRLREALSLTLADVISEKAF